MSLLPIISALAGRSGNATSNTPAISTDTILFVFNGESNSGGVAPNSSATSAELSVRPSIQILDNTGLTSFQNLHIGVNNLIGHAGLEAYMFIAHGWENGLAGVVETTGIAGLSQIYLAKTGQGGSRIADWNTGGTYETTMRARVDAAISILNSQGKSYTMVWFFSQGVNDIIAGTNPLIWKAGVQAYFAHVRSIYGAQLPIMMTKFYTPTNTGYNTTIDSIAAADPYTKAIDTTGATYLVDGNHWDYLGMKLVNHNLLTGFLLTL